MTGKANAQHCIGVIAAEEITFSFSLKISFGSGLTLFIQLLKTQSTLYL
jgi:hypothetical protein